MKKLKILNLVLILSLILSTIVPMGSAFKEAYPQGTFTRSIMKGSLTSFSFVNKKDFEATIEYTSDSPISMIILTESQRSNAIEDSNVYFHGVKGVDYVDAIFNETKASLIYKIPDNQGYYVYLTAEQFNQSTTVTVSTYMDELSSNAIYFGIGSTVVLIGLITFFFIKRKKIIELA